METPTTKPVVIFLSAVSREFHQSDPSDPTGFVSYRAHLAESLRAMRQPHEIVMQEEALRRADPESLSGQLAVVSQENLAQGFGDLLGALDREVRESTMVLHLVGDLAGAIPEAPALQRLLEAYPNLLSHEPELRQSLGDLSEITYTQWELWLAFHHRARRLVFFGTPAAPRSPASVQDMADMARQLRHRERIEATGEHRATFNGQTDLVRQAIRALVREGLTADPSPGNPEPEALVAARELLEKLVPEIVASIKKPDSARFYVADRAGMAAWVAALDTVAAAYQLNRRALVDLLDERLGYLLERAEASREAEVYLELGFTLLALGEYGAAIKAAERAATLATGAGTVEGGPDERFLNAQNLIADAAMACHDPARAMRAFQAGGGRIDKERFPVLWADYHEPFAKFCVTHAQWQAADGLISDILDVREDNAEESPAALAEGLDLWATLLYELGKYQQTHDVSRRSAEIRRGLLPRDLAGVARSWSLQSLALHSLGRFTEAEPLLRRALAIFEARYGSDHPNVASGLDNLAQLLQATNRLAEAEPLTRRALAIDEANYGNDHPNVATHLNNLAQLLKATYRLAEAESLMRRALAIYEASFGKGHPKVASGLANLAQLFQATNRLAEAEPLMRRALATDETSYGKDHPNVATHLNNLASILRAANRLAEAESLIRRALAIDEASFGKDHPKVATDLNNLATLLQATNRLAEAEPLMRRALAISKASFGKDHPKVVTELNNLTQLLKATNRLAEVEPLMRRALRILVMSLGVEHPTAQTVRENYVRMLQEMQVAEEEIERRVSEEG